MAPRRRQSVERGAHIEPQGGHAPPEPDERAVEPLYFGKRDQRSHWRSIGFTNLVAPAIASSTRMLGYLSLFVTPCAIESSKARRPTSPSHWRAGRTGIDRFDCDV